MNLLLLGNTGRHNTGDEGAPVWTEMVVAVTGNMKDFDQGKGNWMECAEQLQCYYLANIIEGDNQKYTLVTVMEDTAYALLWQLVAPGKIGDKSFADLSKVMEDHCNHKLVILQRYKFNTHVRWPNESVMMYVSQLQSLAAECE